MRHARRESKSETGTHSTQRDDRTTAAADRDGRSHSGECLRSRLGNQTLQALCANGFFQSRLTVGRPDDPTEREARHVAQQVVGPTVTDVDPITARPRRRHSNDGLAPLPSDRVASIDSITGGEPMETPTRSYFEHRFGHDFGDVRVHTDPTAAMAATALDADAVTVGTDIVFAGGKYNPDSRTGRELIAHELTHVIQQGGNGTPSRVVHRQASTAATKEPPDTYTVQSGDTLWDIATAYYGDGTEYHRIQAATDRLDDDQTHIEPGWTLQIPARPPAQDDTDNGREDETPSPAGDDRDSGKTPTDGNGGADEQSVGWEDLVGTQERWETFRWALQPLLTAETIGEKEERKIQLIFQFGTPENRRRFARQSARTTLLKNRLSEDAYTEVWGELFKAGWVLEDTAFLFDLIDRRYDIELEVEPGTTLYKHLQDEDYGKGGTELDRQGLLRVFLTFRDLPKRHVEHVEGIAAEKTDYEKGVAGEHKDAIINLVYDTSAVKERNEIGMFSFDRTLAHEVAHAIDRNDTYSERPDFLAITGWKPYDTGAELLKDLQSDVTINPIEEISPVSSAEQTAAENAIQFAFMSDTDDPGAVKTAVEIAYNLAGLDHDGSQGSHRSTTELADSLSSTVLLKHYYVWGRPTDDSDDRADPWYLEPYDYLDDRQYHQGYDDRPWWSYDTAARNKEYISEYQFRTPGEEFAEVYAEYHLSDGATVPARFKGWFERQGLHE